MSFDLREKGDWAKLEEFNEACFTKYENNVDIQVLLCRIQLCIFTFYIMDIEQANLIYEKIMTLLWSTKYPAWHHALILALKVQIRTKNKEFEEAELLLNYAKQTMQALSPCLSTGTVLLSEAKYLASLLKCTPRSKSANSMRDRTTKAYLTAIDHHRKEKIFEIKSFLNQVYVLLALFVLGIDPVDTQLEDTNKFSDEAALQLAEHYLNLFENTC